MFVNSRIIPELSLSYAAHTNCISTEKAFDVMNSWWCAAVIFRVRALAELILIEQM